MTGGLQRSSLSEEHLPGAQPGRDPKNDKERFVPMAPVLAKVVRSHIERFGTTTVSLPWERLNGEVQEHELIFSWSDGRHLNARLHDELV